MLRRFMFRFSCCILPVLAALAQPAHACTRPVLTAGTPDAPQQTRSTMSAGATDPALQLQGNWSLTKVANVAAPKGASMMFFSDRVEVSVGCNTISAVPILGPGFVRFRDVIATKMTCAPDIQVLETQVVDALSRVVTMQVGAGDILSFYDGVNDLQFGAVRVQ
ncbi:META domain-containing protein [Tateyamaria sp.]|uniref:META domain-containing protein n=1 Tax=Tateyamaria sp. TaxID=1929288 RepID=UPI00329B6CC0